MTRRYGKIEVKSTYLVSCVRCHVEHIALDNSMSHFVNVIEGAGWVYQQARYSCPDCAKATQLFLEDGDEPTQQVRPRPFRDEE